MAKEEKKGIFRRAHEGGMKAAGGHISAASRGLSTALMQSAFEKFGTAFNDTGFRGSRGQGGPQAGIDQNAMAPWRAAGAKAADSLNMRWLQMEFEEFQDSHVEGWKNNMKTVSQEFKVRNAMLDDGMWEDPTGQMVPLDTTSEVGRERLLRYRGELFTNYYGQMSDITMNLSGEAAKYPNNTLIGKQVAEVIKFQSDKLMNVANPQERIQAEQSYADVMATERNSKAAMLQAKATAKASTLNEPNSIRQGLDDARIGVQGILPWMTSGPGAELLHSPAGEPFRNSAQERYRQYLIDEESFVDDGEGGEGTQKLDNKMKSSERTILNIAAVDYLRSIDPKAAEAAKIYTPQFFAHEVTGQDKPKGIIKAVRLSPKQKKVNIKSWETEVGKKLNEYMADPTNPTDIESALEFILEQWLPQAIVGDTEDNIPSGLLSTQSEATAEYREEIKAAMTKYLNLNWGKISAIAKAENLDLFKRERNLRASKIRGKMGRRSRRRGLKD